MIPYSYYWQYVQNRCFYPISNFFVREPRRLKWIYLNNLTTHNLFRSSPGSVTFSLTAAVVSTEISISEHGFRVNSLQGGPTQALQEILGQVLPMRKMMKQLRLAAVDLFPEDDAFNYSEGSCEKNPIMESHLYDCIGLLALTHNFSWSRWNLLSGCRMCVLLMREIIEHRRIPIHSTLLVTPLKAWVLQQLFYWPLLN